MLQPLHDYVLLKKEKEEKTTASGIILTSGKEKSKLAVHLLHAQERAFHQIPDRKSVV